MSHVINDAAQATPEWLTGVLGAGSVVDVRTQPPIPGNSTIIPLELTYSAGIDAPTRIILKLAAGSNRANQREVEFYAAIRHIPQSLPVISCYDAVYDEDASTCHLLLEDLSSSHESHPPSFLPPTVANAERIVPNMGRAARGRGRIKEEKARILSAVTAHVLAITRH